GSERREVAFKQALIDKLTHEVAILRRLKYAVTSEKFCAGMSAEQKSLLEETLDSDIAQLTAEGLSESPCVLRWRLRDRACWTGRCPASVVVRRSRRRHRG